MMKHQPLTEQATKAATLVILKLLARREHTAFEIKKKLIQKGFAADVISKTIDFALSQQWINHHRYTETLIGYFARRGYGPIFIENYFREQAIETEVIYQSFTKANIDWTAVLTAAWLKKYRGIIPKTSAEKAQQIRFLQYRGFSLTEIHHLIMRKKTS